MAHSLRASLSACRSRALRLLHGIRTVGAGPDMSLFLFTKNIIAGEPIDVFNFGQATHGISPTSTISSKAVVANAGQGSRRPIRTWDGAKTRSGNVGGAPYRLYNIGNNQPVELMYFIECIEKGGGPRRPIKNMLPLQPGDVARGTFCGCGYAGGRYRLSAEGRRSRRAFRQFVAWYRDHYRI